MTDRYVVYCLDQPGSEGARAAALDDHLAHIETYRERIYFAAALKDQAGGPSGSLMIVEAISCADAKQFVQTDPFYAAGAWKSLQVHRLGRAVGNWVGIIKHPENQASLL